MVQGLGGVLELLGNGPGLSGAGDGIAAKGEDEGVSHGWASERESRQCIPRRDAETRR
jgi:hypothetical protein